MACRLRKPLGVLVTAQQHGDMAMPTEIKQERNILVPEQKNRRTLETLRRRIDVGVVEGGLVIERPHPLPSNPGKGQTTQFHDVVIRNPHRAQAPLIHNSSVDGIRTQPPTTGDRSPAERRCVSRQ